MALIDFPNPVAWFEGVKNDDQRRDMINAAASALYSAQITFLWETGKAARGKFWSFEGPALMRTATSMYLTLAELEKSGFLTLTVPKDLLEPDNLAVFQTEHVKK